MNAGGRQPPMVALPHGLVVVSDEAMRRAVVKLRESKYRAMDCSDIDAAKKLVGERGKEFDFVVVSDALSRSLTHENKRFFCDKAGLRLVVLRRGQENYYSFVTIQNSGMGEEFESVRRSTTNGESHTPRLPAATPHGDSNGSTTTAAPAMAAVASSSSVNRATSRRERRRETTAAEQVGTQGVGGLQEQSAQHQQRKPRLVWTTELKRIFKEAHEQLLPTGDAVPTKILKRMKSMMDPMNDPGLTREMDPTNDPGLTRENVSSYLQKYRMKNPSVPTNSIQRQQRSPAPHQHIMHPRALHTQLASCVNHVTTNLSQQNICHYQPQPQYDESSMHHQLVERLPERHCNELSNKHYQPPQVFTQANYHGYRNMHGNMSSMQHSNVMQPPNLINAKEVNMPFNREGVDAGIHQRQPIPHQASERLPQFTVAATFCQQNGSPEHHIQAYGAVDMSTAQASWRDTVTQDKQPICQNGSEQPSNDSSNNTNGRSEDDNYLDGRKNSEADVISTCLGTWPI